MLYGVFNSMIGKTMRKLRLDPDAKPDIDASPNPKAALEKWSCETALIRPTLRQHLAKIHRRFGSEISFPVEERADVPAM